MASSTRGFVRLITSEPRTLAADFDRDGWNDQEREINQRKSFGETRGYWIGVSRELTALLDGFDVALADAPAVVPWLPEVRTVGDVLRIIILHLRSHRLELARGLIEQAVS